VKVLITGINGFIGKNLNASLAVRKDITVVGFTRESDVSQLVAMVRDVDFIFHLAGSNRPKKREEFHESHVDLTHHVCEAIIASGRKIPILYSSSTQADQNHEYGSTKKTAEDILHHLNQKTATPAYIFRLPNIFGKWSKPNYNSVVATFCHNIARDLPIIIDDYNKEITLAHIDDVVHGFIRVMDNELPSINHGISNFNLPCYAITIGDLAKYIENFKSGRDTLTVDKVGSGFLRSLYSTYVSFLPEELFAYKVPKYVDSRGVFVEMIKTVDSGQISYFSMHPGVTRGGHFHNTKTEKFLVMAGQVLFRFKDLITQKNIELIVDGQNPYVVETIPGWAHEVVNISDRDAFVMLWANEVFDSVKPDTYSYKI